MHVDMVESGERIMYQPLDYKDLGSAQPRWPEGAFICIRMHTGEKLVATSEGICKTGSTRRRAERWKADGIMKPTGTPWKPCLYTGKDYLLSKPPPRAIIKNDDAGRMPREVDEAPVLHSVAITRRDLVNCGYTPASPGCYAAANDRKHKPHTTACQERISKALEKDDAQPHRDREDVFLKNAITEADAHRLQDNAIIGEDKRQP